MSNRRRPDQFWGQMTMQAAKMHLVSHWPNIKEELLAGDYTPNLVRGAKSPKQAAGNAAIGHSHTVMDRLIQ